MLRCSGGLGAVQDTVQSTVGAVPEQSSKGKLKRIRKGSAAATDASVRLHMIAKIPCCVGCKF